MCRVAAIAVLTALAVLRPDMWAGAAVAIILIASLPGARSRAVAAAVALLVIVSAWIADARHRAGQLHPALDGVTVDATLRIASPPAVSDGRMRFIASQPDPTLPRRIRVNWYDADVVPRTGERWHLRLRLRSMHGRRNPHGYDAAMRSRIDRIGGAAEVVHAPGVNRLQSRSDTWLGRARMRVRARIERALPDGPPRAVLIALTTGDRGGMDADTRRAFVATGTSHLMAISGLHVGLVAALGYWVGGRLPVPRRWVARDRGLLTGLVVSLLYALISGFGIPARRAWIVLLLGAVCLASRRAGDPLRVLAIAALMIVVVTPLATLAPAFSLSFTAVLVLALAHRLRGCRRPGRAPSWWRRLAHAQLLLSASLMPLTLAWFGEVSVIGPVINLGMVPLFSLLVVPGALGAAALAALDLPAAGLLSVVHATTGASLSLLTVAARWPNAALALAALPPALLVLLFVGALIGVLGAGLPGRRLALVLLTVPFAWRPPPVDAACALVTMLDVGQGTAITVSTRRRHFLYDTGPVHYRAAGAAERVVVPHLRAVGVRAVDGVIVSHGDADHAGGLGTILREFPSATVLAGGGVMLPGSAIPVACRRGQRWRADGIDFDVLWPPADTTGLSDNDRSCVLQIRAGAASMLITGDIEARAEAALVELGLPRADVVSVPHHGSQTSSTAAFVAGVGATHALVSAAPGNRWGFPHALVTARWTSHGAIVWNTAEHGALAVRMCAASGISVSPAVSRSGRARVP